MHFFRLLLFILLMAFALPQAHAQSATETPPLQYQAIQLNDQNTKYIFSGKTYTFHEDANHLSIQTIEQMVRSGTIIPHLTRSNYINIGSSDTGTWIIIPVINKSSKDIWSLDLGSIKDGRFTTFKDIVLYNMNTEQYILNTQSTVDKSNIGTSILLTIERNKTTFFLLYLKPLAGVPLYTFPTLSKNISSATFDIMNGWILILLAFTAFVIFLKFAKDSRSLSGLFVSCAWLIFLIPLIINSNFLYFVSIDMELIIPFIWMFATLGFVVGFITIKEGQEDISVSLLSGIASASFIISLVGIITLKSIPNVAGYLIYIPIIITLFIIIGTTWLVSLNFKRPFYLHISNTSFLLSIFLILMFFLNIGIIPVSTLTVFIPQIIFGFSALTCIFSIEQNSQSLMSSIEPSDNLFTENKITKKELTSLQEAKEKSEHHRLMQVVERERKVMSDLQVKSAQQNEDMRRAKEAADEANRAKSAFLAVVSHEIRTPMTGIMGMLRLLQDTQLSKEQKEYATTIKDSGDAMLALLNDILDFEKIESGKMDLEHINFDFKRLIRSVHTLMRGHAEAKNINLLLEVDGTLPNWTYGDPTRLRQVLLNLINNAIKFTSKGDVILRIRNLTGETPQEKEKNHQIYFAVQDSGIGIGPESQKKLFMPFAQADSTISRKYGGTGLGLAICKRLIEAMGGAISINSKQGEGSTFFFTIAMQEGNEILGSFDEASTSSDDGPLSKRILKSPILALIVDDNGINQKVVAGFVEKLGGKSMTAGNGADTLYLLSQHKFDVVFLDIELPDMSGVEVTQRIRALPIQTKSNIPIIALTGNAQDDDIKTYLAAGMNDVAGKPVSYEKISELLGKIDNDFYKTKISDHDIEFSDIPIETTPLHTYLSTLSSPMDVDEEDSFEFAVKQFEEREKLSSQKVKTSTGLSSYGLDEKILNSLKSGLNIDQIQEILVSFYEKADELIADIGNAYLQRDAIALNARAHELKGMAGNFGFSDLGNMCAIIEKAAKNNQSETAKSEIDLLGENYAIARSHLNKWLSEQ